MQNSAISSADREISESILDEVRVAEQAVRDILADLDRGARVIRISTKDSLVHDGLCTAIGSLGVKGLYTIHPIHLDMLEQTEGEDARSVFKRIARDLYIANRGRPREILRRRWHLLLGLLASVTVLIGFTKLPFVANMLGISPAAASFLVNHPFYMWCLAAGILAAGFAGDRRIARVRGPNPYVQTVEDLVDDPSAPLSADRFIPLVKKWTPRGKRIVFVINHLNWCLDEQVDRFLLKSVTLADAAVVFTEDALDMDTNHDDFFSAAKRVTDNTAAHEMPRINTPTLLWKAFHVTKDDIFCRALRREVERLRIGSCATAEVCHNLSDLYADYKKSGELSLAEALRTIVGADPERIEARKIKLICQKILTDQLGLSGTTSRPVRVFMAGFLFAHHLLQDGLSLDELRQLWRANDPKGTEYTDSELESELTGLVRCFPMSDNGKPIAWDSGREQFILRHHTWMADYVVLHADQVVKCLPSFSELKQRHEYAKFFLHARLARPTPLCQRLVEYCESHHDRFVFGIALALKLKTLSGSTQEAGFVEGSSLVESNRLLARVWTVALDFPSEEDPGVASVFQRELTLGELCGDANPYETVCFPVAAQMFGASYLDDSFKMDDVLEHFPRWDAGKKLTAPGDREFYQKAVADLRRLEVRHRFNQGKCDAEEVRQYPLLRLLDLIDRRVFVLLPHISPEDEDQLPIADLDEFLNDETILRAQDMNVLLLLAVSVLHNSYYCTFGGAIQHRAKASLGGMSRLGLLLETLADKLKTLGRAPEGFLEELKYNFHRANFSCLVNLCRKCGVEDVFAHDSAADTGLLELYAMAEEGYRSVEHYFGSSECLFWATWFAIRGALDPVPVAIEHPKGKKDVSVSGPFQDSNRLFQDARQITQVEAMLSRLVNISERHLNYVYHNAEIVYASCVTHSAMTPASAYQAMKRILENSPAVPAYLELMLLERLALICFNGEFDDRDKLKRECRHMCQLTLDRFGPRLAPAKKASLELTIARTYAPGSEEAGKVLDVLALHEVDLMEQERGVYSLQQLQRAWATGEEGRLATLKSATEKYLKDQPFYYLQYLAFAIRVNLPERVARQQLADFEARGRALVETRQELIRKHNVLAESLQNTEVPGQVWHNDELRELAHKIQDNSQEIDAIRNKFRNATDCTPLIEELETTLRAFIAQQDFERYLQGEQQPSRYVVAHSSELLADHYLGMGVDGRRRAVELLEAATEQYLALEELVKAMECLLELKYCTMGQPMHETLFQKVRDIASLLSRVGPKADDGEARELVQCLLHDYLNTETDTTRTNYCFEKDVKGALRKNVEHPDRLDSPFLPSSKRSIFDGDCTPFRRALTRFHHSLFCDKETSVLIKDAEVVLTCAEDKLSAITHSDIESMRRIVKHLSNTGQAQEPAQLDAVMKLEQRINDVNARYQERVRQFVQQQLPSVIRDGAHLARAPSKERSTSEEPNDCTVFISAHNSDYRHAQRVYDYLTKRGICAFFCESMLSKRGNAAYCKEIDNVLDHVVHLVVVTSSVENVKASFVASEWGKFSSEKDAGRKPGNMVTVVVRPIPYENLPLALRCQQAIPLNRQGLDTLFDYVGPAATATARAKAARLAEKTETTSKPRTTK